MPSACAAAATKKGQEARVPPDSIPKNKLSKKEAPLVEKGKTTKEKQSTVPSTAYGTTKEEPVPSTAKGTTKEEAVPSMAKGTTEEEPVPSTAEGTREEKTLKRRPAVAEAIVPTLVQLDEQKTFQVFTMPEANEGPEEIEEEFFDCEFSEGNLEGLPTLVDDADTTPDTFDWAAKLDIDTTCLTKLGRALRIILPCCGIDGCTRGLKHLKIRFVPIQAWDLEAGYKETLTKHYLESGLSEVDITGLHLGPEKGL